MMESVDQTESLDDMDHSSSSNQVYSYCQGPESGDMIMHISGSILNVYNLILLPGKKHGTVLNVENCRKKRKKEQTNCYNLLCLA